MDAGLCGSLYLNALYHLLGWDGQEEKRSEPQFAINLPSVCEHLFFSGCHSFDTSNGFLQPPSDEIRQMSTSERRSCRSAGVSLKLPSEGLVLPMKQPLVIDQLGSHWLFLSFFFLPDATNV